MFHQSISYTGFHVLTFYIEKIYVSFQFPEEKIKDRNNFEKMNHETYLRTYFMKNVKKGPYTLLSNFLAAKMHLSKNRAPTILSQNLLKRLKLFLNTKKSLNG